MQNWTVLLIGGNSGAGKTTIAAQISRDLGISFGQVDDYRVTLQRTVSQEAEPILHTFLQEDAFLNYEPEKMCKNLIWIGKYLSHAIEAVIERHILMNIPIILEGDGIVPIMAAKYVTRDSNASTRVQSVFILETSEEQLFKVLLKRERNFSNLTKIEQQHKCRLSVLYGQWLKEEATKYNLPILASQPQESLAERLLSITDRGI